MESSTIAGVPSGGPQRSFTRISSTGSMNAPIVDAQKLLSSKHIPHGGQSHIPQHPLGLSGKNSEFKENWPSRVPGIGDVTIYSPTRIYASNVGHMPDPRSPFGLKAANYFAGEDHPLMTQSEPNSPTKRRLRKSHSLQVPSHIPGFMGHIAGKAAETVYGACVGEANEIAQKLRRHNPYNSIDYTMKAVPRDLVCNRLRTNTLKHDLMPHLRRSESDTLLTLCREKGQQWEKHMAPEVENKYTITSEIASRPARYLDFLRPDHGMHHLGPDYTVGVPSLDRKLEQGRWKLDSRLCRDSEMRGNMRCCL